MRTSILDPLSGYGLGGVQATVRVNHPPLQQISRATMFPVAAESRCPGPQFGYGLE